jgi:hypothetical protein
MILKEYITRLIESEINKQLLDKVKDVKIQNPKTKRDIKVSTALASKTHPAYSEALKYLQSQEGEGENETVEQIDKKIEQLKKDYQSAQDNMEFDKISTIIKTIRNLTKDKEELLSNKVPDDSKDTDKNSVSKNDFKSYKSKGINIRFSNRSNDNEKAMTNFNKKYEKLDLEHFTTTIISNLSKTGIKNISQQDIEIEVEENGNFTFSLTHPDCEIIREFQDDEVYHTLFKLDKNLQGSGTMKKVFVDLINSYEKAGIKKIKTNANIDVGGYAWAKAGYSIKNKKDTLNLLNSNLYSKIDKEIVINPKTNETYTITDEDSDLVDNVVFDFYKTNKEDTPFPMELIANLKQGKLGKAVLLHSDWNGEIDLTNKKQTEYFKNYISK